MSDDTDVPSTDPVFQQFAVEQQTRRAAIQQAFREILERLRSTSIRRIHIDYDGSGDSGCVESIAYFDKEEREVSQANPIFAVEDFRDPDGETGTLSEVLETLTYELLPGGWEINDGSIGGINIEIDAGTVELRHGWRSIEVDYESFNLLSDDQGEAK